MKMSFCLKNVMKIVVTICGVKNGGGYNVFIKFD